MRSIFTLFTFLLLPFAVFSQANYQPGYVVKANGDTVKGLIDQREWIQSPRMISFKLEANTSSQNFSAKEIQGFGVTGKERFITYKGMISMDRTILPNIADSIDNTRKKDTLFLKQIITGKYITLYVNVDALKTRYFIQDNYNDPAELSYKVYYSGNNRATAVERYKGQLAVLAGKYTTNDKSIMKLINYAQYTEDDLLRIVAKINGDTDGLIKRKFYSRKFAGLLIMRTKNSAYIMESLNNRNNSGVSYAPKITAGIDIFTNPHVQRFMLRTEFSVFYQNISIPMPNPRLNITDRTYSTKELSFGLTPQIIWNAYNKENLKVYAGAGLSANYGFYFNDKLFSGGSYQPVKDKVNKFDAMSFAIQYTAGVTINKRFDITAVYLKAASYSAHTKSYFPVGRQAIGLGGRYFFK